MHEHFYEITNENSVFKDWFAYLEAEKKMKADVRAFKEKHGIKADVYMIHCGKFWVDPDENTQFTEQFGKEREQGLAPFKKTSPIGKAFKEAEIIAARKPFITFFFKNPVRRYTIIIFYIYLLLVSERFPFILAILFIRRCGLYLQRRHILLFYA